MEPNAGVMCENKELESPNNDDPFGIVTIFMRILYTDERGIGCVQLIDTCLDRFSSRKMSVKKRCFSMKQHWIIIPEKEIN